MRDTDIQIPPEAVEALREELRMSRLCADPATARAALRAALAAWPGMRQRPSWELRTHKRSVEIILPLQEARDDRR